MFLKVGDEMATGEAKMMTAEEKFVFDLQGYIVIKNVLATEEVAEINEISDRIFPRDYGDEDNRKENWRVAPNRQHLQMGPGLSATDRPSKCDLLPE